ncbi:MAG: TetR/AcrR family transcriptional regulator [Candidatus Dadabacteria bacterium]|nr:MAG: TetR/AcrR family transcriptional regulator [Candidatus Dadabacteria bacterium]
MDFEWGTKETERYSAMTMSCYPDASMSEAIQQQIRDQREQLWREHLCAAAERVFARRGSTATVREIAKEAGIAVGTIYNVYGGKNELWREVLRRHHDALTERAREIAANAGDITAVIAGGARLAVEYYTAHEDFLRIQLWGGHAWGLGDDETDLQRQAWQAGVMLIAASLRSAMDRGEIPEGDAEELARLVLATHQVGLAGWINADPRPDPEALIERLTRYLLRLIGIPDAAAAL